MSLTKFWNKIRRQREQRPVVWGMTIDLDKCSGCMACVVACRAENNVPAAGEEKMDLGQGIFWLEMIPITHDEGTESQMKLMPTPCNQCDDTPCITYCPTHATETNLEGITGMTYDRCIGCRYCTVSCPYTRRYFNWGKPDFAPEMRPLLNPEVSVRTVGVVEKCNFCEHRIREAEWNAKIEKRPLRDGEVRTACQTTCPSEAIEFGNLQDSNSKVYKRARGKRADVLLGELGTNPKVFYLREEDAHGNG